MLANNLQQKGFNVIGTSREPEKYKGKVSFKLLRLDIADDASIAEFSRELAKETSKLDVLVNNAGFMVTGIAEETPIEVGKQQFETNFWGTVKVTNALLPIFRKQRSSLGSREILCSTEDLPQSLKPSTNSNGFFVIFISQ